MTILLTNCIERFGNRALRLTPADDETVRNKYVWTFDIDLTPMHDTFTPRPSADHQKSLGLGSALHDAFQNYSGLLEFSQPQQPSE